jgi:hypothetical protein
LLWKELQAEPHLDGPQLHPHSGLFLLIVAGLAVLGLILLPLGHGESFAETARWLNLWVRGTGTSLMGLLLVLVAFYAAGSVSRERERQTLDSLRTVPEESRDVLLAKWLGGFLSARKAWWCLAVVWGFGLVTGGLNILALPLLLIAFAVYTALTASLGLYCSTVCRSTVRATVVTLLVLLALGAGPLLLLYAWGDVFLPGRPPGVVGWLAWWDATGLAPLWALSFRYDELWGEDPWGFCDRILTALAVLACYALGAWALWRRALARFRAEAGPAPRRGPPPEDRGSASRR